MHPSQSQVHYAPASVGALMDPAFLRGVVLDADGVHPPGADTPRIAVKERWRMALRSAASLLRRARSSP